ncbi:predicted protein [Verticillium alfalfae VaMs.102]|uniref:Predicted protein n=1 Tax=Verticillium alfalfae (strain VaMs.102 / ATCC MYA-4576 / FGSC 10136) TaxID=526221 RepID=C9SCJ4_VERA1|nr:predicted protein [Verticillium alfalfae VaMs.102]EEY16809.1 predicted protein [Verticillium alfalfae VaMs.102]
MSLEIGERRMRPMSARANGQERVAAVILSIWIPDPAAGDCASRMQRRRGVEPETGKTGDEVAYRLGRTGDARAYVDGDNEEELQIQAPQCSSATAMWKFARVPRTCSNGKYEARLTERCRSPKTGSVGQSVPRVGDTYPSKPSCLPGCRGEAEAADRGEACGVGHCLSLSGVMFRNGQAQNTTGGLLWVDVGPNGAPGCHVLPCSVPIAIARREEGQVDCRESSVARERKRKRG